MSLPAAQRQIIVISGCSPDNLKLALQLAQNLHTLQLDDPKKANQFLGQEFDAVIYNAQSFNEQEQFDPNAFGAVTGTIRAGGYLILLRSEKWSQHSLFLKRFDHVLDQNLNVRFIDSDSTEVQPLKTLEPRQTHASEDQNKAVKAIIRVVKGHRRRPLVITADRGRGKSAALGIAAAQLYQQGCQNIIICAPSKTTAAVVLQYAEGIPLQFYSPDELQQKKPQADLLLIDEAAAIPVPLLIDFVKHYSRLVFATTQHGYEGSGRGFTLSFKKNLNKVAPEWKSCELTTPIRWGTNDLLEQFVYQALLLNAEAVDAGLNTTPKRENCQFEQIHRNQLLKNEPFLKEIFGLLVSAHYQTRPSDFRQILDDTSIRIFTLRHQLHHQNHVIAVSLVVEEGGINNNLAEKIFSGTRRIKGHLVAQALAANVGLPEAPCLYGQRILRIAVHPSIQQQGFGTYLLKHLINYLAKPLGKEKQLDYLSTSFGATNQLLHFWQKSGFTPVYLSMKRDASSGTHSVIMLNAQSQNGKQMQSTARQYFIQSFPYLLSDPFRHLESNITFELLQAPDQTSDKLALTDNDKRIIAAFAKAQRGYENSLYPIWKLVLTRFSLSNTEELTKNEKAIIILKVLQKHNWKTCCTKLEGTINSKKNALFLLRKCTKMLLEK